MGGLICKDGVGSKLFMFYIDMVIRGYVILRMVITIGVVSNFSKSLYLRNERNARSTFFSQNFYLLGFNVERPSDKWS